MFSTQNSYPGSFKSSQAAKVHTGTESQLQTYNLNGRTVLQGSRISSAQPPAAQQINRQTADNRAPANTGTKRSGKSNDCLGDIIEMGVDVSVSAYSVRHTNQVSSTSSSPAFAYTPAHRTNYDSDDCCSGCCD